MKRFRMGVVAAGKFYVGILVFVVLCCGALTFMSCPQAPMMGVTGHSRFVSLITLGTVCKLWLIYIAGDGLGLGPLSYTEIESRDPSLNLWNVNMFCIVQCSHWVWNPILSVYPNLSVSM